MSCKNPLLAYRGPKGLVFTQSEAFGHREIITIPCKKCINCRLAHSRDNATRITHEASMHDANSFITLTYSEENLPWDESLSKTTFQKFMKRLRKRIEPTQIRFFACGEYGSKSNRPHYHACIFGYDFPDKELYRVEENGNHLYVSETLAKAWPFGFSSVGELSYESARYVAGYIHKKITGPMSEDHYKRFNRLNGEEYDVEPEFQLGSLKPGIGKTWYDKYSATDLWPKRYCTIGGKKRPPPVYYWELLKREDPDKYQEMKRLQHEDMAAQEDIPGRRMAEIAEARQIAFNKKESRKI